MSRMKNWGKHTHVGEVINFIETLPCDQTFIRTYLPIVQRVYSSDIYFLSVIMRTQGKRPHELFEALFSLTLQLDKDFEVLVVCHNADDSALVSVQDILCNESLSSLTIRMIQVDGGSRATPLNHGFAHARGEYIACLDDDDTVSDNWVSSFHKAANARPGTMLHTQIIVQEWDRDENGAFPCGDENHIYCKPYNEIIQLAYNSCPLHSIAFPGYIFRQCGIIFNEELTTVEDWDMLIRVQGLTGVTEIPHPTGLYKFWKNRDNSYSSHSQEEWAKNHKLVKDNIANSLYILSRGG
ncbi:MAG: glycosyltransferase family 2 protein [Mailhella sp.]|nr:glycosyltransferase family 2 protein [Mailhella sp.]